MERKIGDIFEYNSEWYQYVKDDMYDYCKDCAFFINLSCKALFGNRDCWLEATCKKLEKVGEPVTINGTLVQKMKTPVAIGCKQCVLNNNGCSIVYEKCFTNELYVNKQNQENMKENKLKLKPFDLEKAKDGKPVCTRDGRKARIICFDAKRKDNRGIVALVPSKDEGYEGTDDIITYPINGNYHGGHENDGDLMMLPEKKIGWVIIAKDKNGEIYTEYNIYPTKDNAVNAIYNISSEVIDVVKIEWEE